MTAKLTYLIAALLLVYILGVLAEFNRPMGDGVHIGAGTTDDGTNAWQ